MPSAHTEEQRLIRESARSFLTARASVARLAAVLALPGA
jgi:hypothetical protein